ncbi:MAG: hypothetical protein IIC82_07855 [Chloroflexi bacterium]|nr:hypothetical protein [Chloroflexota bacterium]
MVPSGGQLSNEVWVWGKVRGREWNTIRRDASQRDCGAGNALGSMEAGFVAGIVGAANALTFGGVAAMVFVVSSGLAWKELWRHRV